MFYLTVWSRNVKQKCPSRLLSGARTQGDWGCSPTSEKPAGQRRPLVDYFAAQKRSRNEHRRCE